MKRIKKNKNLIYETLIKTSNRHRLRFCSDCHDLIYDKKTHKCHKREDVIATPKKVSPTNKWTLPVYQYLKNVYGFCLICWRFKAGHKHLSGP